MYNALLRLHLLIQCTPTMPTRIPWPLICPLAPKGLLRSWVFRCDLWSSSWTVHARYIVLLSTKVSFLSVFFEELDVAI